MAGEIGHWCGIDLIGGGLGAVDKIDGAALQDKEGFLVITPTVFAPFSLDDDSGAGEDSPQIISPNTNPGTKRWILAGGVFAGLTLYEQSIIDGTSSSGTIKVSGTNLLRYIKIYASANYQALRGFGSGTNELRLGAGENDHVVITAAGNVGINVPAPGYALDIDGQISISNGNAYRSKDIGGSSKNLLYIDASDNVIIGSVALEDILLTPGGNVGINDPAPAEKLDVGGNINVTGVYKVDDVQIIKEQQAHIADVATQDLAGGDTIDEAKLESDLTDIVGKINAMLAMLETHGLIAAA